MPGVAAVHHSSRANTSNAPTPVGMTVTCESELTAVEGRKLVFKVSLYDEKGPVGGGVQERFVVNDAKFAAKAESKKG